ncbi:MAG: sugar nucleotide-binding protein [Ignavibacteria bacterium]
MKILITGGSGLLGQYLNRALSRDSEILTLYNSNIGNCGKYNSLKTDLTDFTSLKKIFSSFMPDLVIHTAAISRPETCDELPEEFVLSVNLYSTIELAKLCDQYNAKLIYTSTDLVYAGNQGAMLKEDAHLDPVSLYADTKLKSENEIQKIFDNYIILRTSLLYGMGLNHSMNNFHSMYNNFKNNKPAKLFYDQYRTPLSLSDASELIRGIVKEDIKEIIINFGGRERVSRTELGEMLCEIGKFDRSLIEKISMYDIPKLHKVADVSMNTGLLQALGFFQKSIEESINEILEEHVD